MNIIVYFDLFVSTYEYYHIIIYIKKKENEKKS